MILSGMSGKRISAKSLLPDVFEGPRIITKEEAKKELRDLKDRLKIE